VSVKAAGDVIVPAWPQLVVTAKSPASSEYGETPISPTYQSFPCPSIVTASGETGFESKSARGIVASAAPPDGPKQAICLLAESATQIDPSLAVMKAVGVTPLSCTVDMAPVDGVIVPYVADKPALAGRRNATGPPGSPCRKTLL